MKWKRVLWLFAAFAVAVYFWDEPLFYPVKALVVFFHEISHGTAAVLTGGSIARIELSPQLGGSCVHYGGWELAVIPAGYLGSMLWGALILIISARSRLDRILSQVLGIFLLAMTVGYVRTAFGALLGMSWGISLVALGRKASEQANDAVLQFLGLASMLYAVVDIKEDLIDRRVDGSDASAFARLLGGPPELWGVVWILVAVAGTAWALSHALRKDREAGELSTP
jgi:hypothetical protein